MTLTPFTATLVRQLRQDLAAQPYPTALIPRVESQTLDDRYVLRADLPGVAPEDIEITAAEGVLTLNAQRRLSDQDGSLPPQRRFVLPDDADLDAIHARCQHGVLEISVRKTPKATPRRIVVEAA